VVQLLQNYFLFINLKIPFMRKTSILTTIALITLLSLFCNVVEAQTIESNKVVFDLTKSSHVTKIKSDASIKQSSSEGIVLSARSRRTTLQSETIEVPLENIEPFLAVGLIMNHSNYENTFGIYLRNSKDNENWSDWERIEEIDLDENESDKYRSELLFLDKEVKYVQFMVSMRKVNGEYPSIQDISLSFISPGATPKGALEKSMMDTKAMETQKEVDPTTKAYARPSYVNRKGWGCPQAENTTARTLTTVTHLVIHHSAGNTTSSDFAAIVRSYWDWHVNGNGWADIGYNWLIDGNGVIYKGRAWYSSTKENVLGAHNSGKNGGTVGLCVIGNYINSTVPTSKAWNSTYKILAFLCDKYGLNPKGTAYHSAIGRTNDIIDGHKDSGGGTACPGNIANYYSTIRNSVANLISGPTGPSSLSASIASCPSDEVTFKWSNSGTGWQIHVSTSSSFSTYYLKWVSGLTSYTGPTGFVHSTSGSAFGGFTQGTKYYWRMYYNGSYTSTKSFTMHSCPPTGLSASQASCPDDDVTFKWTNKGTGWQIHVSTSSSFSTYYLKWVSGLTTYTGPAGFVHSSTNAAMTSFKEGTKYYWRMYYVDGYTSTKSFTTHTCAEPVANFTMSESQVCSGSSVAFTNSSQYATSYSWKFTGGSPSTSTAANPNVTYATPGTYSVELTATNSAGSSTKSSSITVLTTPKASFSASLTSVIPDQSIQLANTSEDAISYSWTLSGGSPSTSTDENPVVTYSSPGTYTIALTASNEYCQNVKKVTNFITVVDPISVIDDFETDEGHFYLYPTYSGSTVGISSESAQQRVTTTAYGGSGSLQAKLLDNTSSSSDWFVRLLSGMGSPVNNTPFTSNGALTFWMKTSTANSDAVVQIWVDDSDGLEASPFISVANDGKWHQYSFDLEDFGGTTVTTGNGELDASEVTLDAIILSQTNTSSTWTVYIDDVVQDLSGNGTFLKQSSADDAVEESFSEEISEIIVYPNPNNGLFTVKLDNSDMDEFEISVINTSGTLVYSEKAFSNQFEVDIQDLPQGMYIINVRNESFNETKTIMIAK
jgi:PKD repeat protein